MISSNCLLRARDVESKFLKTMDLLRTCPSDLFLKASTTSKILVFAGHGERDIAVLEVVWTRGPTDAQLVSSDHLT